jgi:hypothetical protein
VYAVHPSRPPRAHRTHRRDWRDGDGDFRRRRRAPERSGLEEHHRRDRAESPREWRRSTAADRAGSRTGDRSADRRRRDRVAERPAAERWARRDERQAQGRRWVPRRYDDYRGSGETDAAIARRVERAGRQAERESMTMERKQAGGAVPEK